MSNQIQNKLSQFEVQPPEGVWNRVANALDDIVLAHTGEMLANIEVEPNKDVWNTIQRQLDGARPAKVIPFHKKYARPLKYGSAVAIFAIIALVTNLLISKRTVSETPAESMAKKVEAMPGNQPPHNDSNAAVDDQRDLAVVNTINYTVNHKNRPQFNRKPATLQPTLLGITSPTDNLVPKIAKRSTIIAFNQNDDKYMAYSMEDGQAVKLPKKMFDALTCPTKDVSCLQKIKQIQEKIAASALIADFTGVLDILNNLGENQ